MKIKTFTFITLFLSAFLIISCKQDVNDVEKEHSFSEWTVELEPTCTSIGLKKRKCTGCGFEETETIPAKGHDWNEGIITTKSTCTSAGVKTYTCSRCKEEKTEVIPANGHKWDSGIVTKQPTCTETGIRTYTCSVCNEIKMESVKARGHSFDGIECKNCHEYSVKLSGIGKNYIDADGLNVTLNSFTYTTTDGYNNYSINYTLKNIIPGSEKNPGIFKIIYKTSSGSLESSYQTGIFNNLYYGNTLTRSYNWKLTADKTFVCLEYIADSQMSSYIFSATPSDELLNWIDGEVSYDIDNIPPSPVTNLQAKYDKNSKQIIVTWKNPKDEDFDCVNLSYTKGGLAVVSNEKIAKETYSISNVEIDGDEYLFTLNSVDWMGNISTSSTINITPSEIPAVQSIELSRYHLAYDDPDQTIKAVARISNAELLDDDTVVKIQVKDSDGNVTNYVANVDIAKGSATATIAVPQKSDNSDTYGSTFIVLCKIGDELADTNSAVRFNVSDSASIQYFLFCENNNLLSEYIFSLKEIENKNLTKMLIEGYNLDLGFSNAFIKIYNSANNLYYTKMIDFNKNDISWTKTGGNNFYNKYIEMALPNVADAYRVVIYLDDIEWGSCQLIIYDSPQFTNIDIPIVGLVKHGSTVSAKISGKYFDTPDVDFSNFTAICPTNSSIVSTTSFTKESDSILYATFTIPDTVGEYEITVKYGLNLINGKLKVQDFSNYSVGDVLLNDGTIIPYNTENLSFTDEQKKQAIGIMYGFNEYGIPCGYLGIYNSLERKYKWEYNPNGSYRMFENIICYPSDFSFPNAANVSTFTGDTNGSDNWLYICSLDSIGSIDSSKTFPAFYYANTYGKNYDFSGVYAERWYMPSISELCTIYKNLDLVNHIISLLNGNRISDNSYWSSSQVMNITGGDAWGVDFSNGFIDGMSKDNDFSVCCVRPFE